MKKSGYFLLGLLLLAAAVGAASWRHVIEPSRTTSRTAYERTAPTARSVAPDRADRSVSRPTARESRQPTTTTTTTTLSSWDMLDLAVNVLNVLVGVIGIWLAISGMRMQRAAAQAQSLPLRHRDR